MAIKVKVAENLLFMSIIRRLQKNWNLMVGIVFFSLSLPIENLIITLIKLKNMIQMKLWAIATLMSCASVFTACTTNDNPVTPQEKPLPKVSTIYTASTVKAERNVAGHGC